MSGIKPTKPQVMGILNVTPDSFSDGGDFVDPDMAVERALRMQEEGADWIDIGGESTRPGANPVSADDEIERVVPIIKRLTSQLTIPISVDTSKPQVMRNAVEAGASMVNDVCALQQDNALTTVADLGVAVCVMHMQGEPRTMQAAPSYPQGVVTEIKQFLSTRIDEAVNAGIAREKIYIDPGFGFGKTLEQNYELLRGLSEFQDIGCPILVGVSRKSMIGQLTNTDPSDRLPGSLAAAVIASIHGARMIRVHDVKETVQALAVMNTCYAPEDSLLNAVNAR